MANSAPATDSVGDFYCGGQAKPHSLLPDLVDLMDGKTESKQNQYEQTMPPIVKAKKRAQE